MVERCPQRCPPWFTERIGGDSQATPAHPDSPPPRTPVDTELGLSVELRSRGLVLSKSARLQGGRNDAMATLDIVGKCLVIGKN